MTERYVQPSFSDFSPATGLEKQLYADLDQLYDFMKGRDSGRSTMRYVGTPYMTHTEQSARDGDSITDHHYGITHWFLIMQAYFPHFSASLNHQKFYEYAAVHDDPEQVTSDVAANLQLDGNHVDRDVKEASAYLKMTENLPVTVQDYLRNNYFSYTRNKADPSTSDKEALALKVFDTLEADCQVLFKGNDWHNFKDIHRQIIETKLIPYSQRLQNLLLQEGNHQAADEVRILASHHLYQYQKKGVSFFDTFSNF